MELYSINKVYFNAGEYLSKQEIPLKSSLSCRGILELCTWSDIKHIQRPPLPVMCDILALNVQNFMVPTGPRKPWRTGRPLPVREKSGNFTQNTGKIRNLINFKSWGNENFYQLFVHKYFLAWQCLAYLSLLILF